MNNWISRKEEESPCQTDILVSDGKMVWVASRSGKRWEAPDFVDGSEPCCGAVIDGMPEPTHWMNLPSPPKE